jgi:hypothetical protein
MIDHEGDSALCSLSSLNGLLICVAVLAIALGTPQVSAGNPLTLEIYYVSSEPKPGWRYFNSTAFPNLGYIAAQPDMSVSQITSASIEKTVQHSTIVHRDGSQEPTEEETPSLIIEFTAADARKLHELTTMHLGDRILFLFGNQPLFAPVIRMAIDEPSVSITLRSEIDPENIKAQLEKLREQKR